MIQTLELEPEPFTKWAFNVIQIGREKGYADNEIKSWIKEWAKLRNYDSEEINHVLRQNGLRVYNRRPVIYQRYPKLTVCPKCVTIGKINVYYPKSKLYPDGKLSYVILHEKIKGTWGNTKTSRKRRCYIRYSDKENSNYLSQQLDFYENRDRNDLALISQKH